MSMPTRKWSLISEGNSLLLERLARFEGRDLGHIREAVI